MLHLLLDSLLLLFKGIKLERSMLMMIDSLFMRENLSVHIISLLFILLIALLSLIGSVGIVITSLLRNSCMALLMLFLSLD